jgi:hypothetical protein
MEFCHSSVLLNALLDVPDTLAGAEFEDSSFRDRVLASDVNLHRRQQQSTDRRQATDR